MRYERELEELQDDLAKLSVGGFVDRLPFKEAPKPAERYHAPKQNGSKPRRPTPTRGSPSPWPTSGARPARTSRCWRCSPTARSRPGRARARWRRSARWATWRRSRRNPHAKLTDISGVGAEKERAISDAVDSYWVKHPQGLTAAAPAPTGDVVASAPTTPAALVWETDEKDAAVEAACYSNLLAWLGNDAPVNVERFLMIRGNRYLVTLAPGGHPSDVYSLRQILSEADGKSVKAEDANPYAGKTVIIDAKPNRIAGSSGTMLVRDAGTKAKAEPEAPAEDAPVKKPKAPKSKAAAKKATPKKKTTVKK
jgi:hypothetical protein